MSTIPLPQRSVWRLRVKYLLFAFVGLMIVYVIQHNEAFLLNDADPVWEHYQPIKWWLLPHGIAGAIAIFLAISQFSSRIRAGTLPFTGHSAGSMSGWSRSPHPSASRSSI